MVVLSNEYLMICLVDGEVDTMALETTSVMQISETGSPFPLQPKQQSRRQSTSMPSASLRERKKVRARESILFASRELINQKGYSHTKMREIARSAAVSYQTLYNYFPTKALILQELLTQGLPDSIATSLAAAPCSSDPVVATIELADCYFDAITYCERDLWREVAVELFKSCSAQNRLLEVIEKDSRQKFIRLFSTANNNRQLDARVDARLLADAIYQLVNCVLMDFLSNPNLSRSEAHQQLTNRVSLLVKPYIISR